MGRVIQFNYLRKRVLAYLAEHGVNLECDDSYNQVIEYTRGRIALSEDEEIKLADRKAMVKEIIDLEQEEIERFNVSPLGMKPHIYKPRSS